MGQPYDEKQQQKLRSFLKMHLKKEQLTLPVDEQIPLVEKKERKQWWLMGLNTAVVLFFGYSFASGATQLPDTLFYVLIVVFVLNIGLIIYQKKRLGELVEYLHWKQHN